MTLDDYLQPYARNSKEISTKEKSRNMSKANLDLENGRLQFRIRVMSGKTSFHSRIASSNSHVLSMSPQVMVRKET